MEPAVELVSHLVRVDKEGRVDKKGKSRRYEEEDMWKYEVIWREETELWPQTLVDIGMLWCKDLVAY